MDTVTTINQNVTYINQDEQIELIGIRLDAARKVFAECNEESWAANYWKTVVSYLETKWQSTIEARDIGMIQKYYANFSGFDIKYDWLELDDSPDVGPFDMMMINFYSDKGVQYGLNITWENAKNKQIQQAKDGLL